MKVLKFGGSSVANATNISRVLDIVRSVAENDRIILVCSAISGCTDTLLEIGRLQSEGRDVSGIAGSLKDRHYSIIDRLFTGVEKTEAREECDSLFAEILAAPDTVEAYGEILSTRIIVRKLICEGVSSRWLDSRKIIVSGDLSSTYANVAAAVEDASVRIFVAPGFIAGTSDGRVCTLGRGGSDYSAALYAAGAKASDLQIWTDVPGIMTTNPKDVPQAVTVPFMSYDAAWRLAEHGAKVLYPPTVEPARLCGLGINIRDTFDPSCTGTVIGPQKASSVWVGIASCRGELFLVADHPFDSGEAKAKIESALRRSRIELTGLDCEEGGIRASVPEGLEKEALKLLHREFFEYESLNTRALYIAGKGAVGTALREMIENRAEAIRSVSGKVLRIEAQVDSSDPEFCARLLSEAPKGAVFVDVTDSEDIYRWYGPLLEAGINIVSSNRRSLAVPYEEYARMKTAALLGGSFLRYETTVGAALPILESIALSANSNDEITGIEAVVSCTLNYILSSDLPFSEALKKAQSIGLTEKDPRQDLEGRDALRKLLILAREAGVPLDEKDVEIEPVPDPEHIGQNQRFVASLTKDSSCPLGYRAGIRLQTVAPDHPAYWLKGTDNAIIVRSAFHPSPLVIQGAGEGARQAASSVLNDILK